MTKNELEKDQKDRCHWTSVHFGGKDEKVKVEERRLTAKGESWQEFQLMQFDIYGPHALREEEDEENYEEDFARLLPTANCESKF